MLFERYRWFMLTSNEQTAKTSINPLDIQVNYGENNHREDTFYLGLRNRCKLVEGKNSIGGGSESLVVWCCGVRDLFVNVSRSVTQILFPMH